MRNRMNDLLGAIQISYTFPRSLLEERISEAWLRLRFRSPLVAAEIIRDKNPDEMGTWVYKPVDLNGAKEWRQTTLHFQQLTTGCLTTELIEEYIQDKLRVPLPFDGNGGLLFHCYVLLEEQGNKAALLIHTSHTILDGPGNMEYPAERPISDSLPA